MDNTHPFFFVKNEIIPNISSLDLLTLSKYVYVKGKTDVKREFYEVPCKDFTEDYVASLISSLEEEEELSIHSTVNLASVPKTKLYFPVIDLATPDMELAVHRLRKVFDWPMEIYFSGRSYHVYYAALLTHTDWLKFMYKLLLVDHSNEPSVIDTRWVGHRLLSGDGTLRWSNNNKVQYLTAPKRVKPTEAFYASGKQYYDT